MENKITNHELVQLNLIEPNLKNCEEYLDFQSHFGNNQNQAHYYCVLNNKNFYKFILIHYAKIHQLGYWLSPNLRGKDISRTCFDITFSLLKKNNPDYLFAIINHKNQPSKKLISHFDFKIMAHCDEKTIFAWYN